MSPSDCPTNPSYESAVDLTLLFDELIDIQDSYAFFCDAITAMMRNNSGLERSTLEGMDGFAEHNRQRSEALKRKFQELLKQYSLESKGQGSH